MSPDAADTTRPPASTRTTRRQWWIFAALTPAVAVGWLLVMPSAPVAQPAVFNHLRHSALACVACHRGVETRARATLPVVSDCAKCHATAPHGISEDQWKSFSGPQGFGWVQVTHVPDHVNFSHRRHVTSGRLACVSCHADVGQRTTPPGTAPIRVDMKACLSCHRKEGITEDCAGCHR